MCRIERIRAARGGYCDRVPPGRLMAIARFISGNCFAVFFFFFPFAMGVIGWVIVGFWAGSHTHGRKHAIIDYVSMFFYSACIREVGMCV